MANLCNRHYFSASNWQRAVASGNPAYRKSEPIMNCREFVDAIGPLLDGELDSLSSAAFEAHQVQCDSCRAYLKSYEQTIKLIRDAHRSPRDPGLGDGDHSVSLTLLDRMTSMVTSRLICLGSPDEPFCTSLYFG